MKWILACFLCCLYCTADAQRLSYGIKVGVGATGSEETAWDVDPVYASYRLSTGWAVGGFARFQLRGGLSATGDIWYYNAGSMYIEEYNDQYYSNNYISRSVTVRTNKLHIPITLCYAIGQRKWRPYVKAGVATNYLFGASYEQRLYDRLSDEHKYAKTRVSAKEVRYTGNSGNTSKWSFQPVAALGTMIGDKTGIEFYFNFGGKDLAVKDNQVKNYGFMLMVSRAISFPLQ